MNPAPKRAVWVGLLLATSTVILAGAILTIGDVNDTFTRKVDATVVFDGVNGLQKGDNIWFSGVKVGIVRSLAFTGHSQVQVALSIDRNATEFIRSDALVKIGSDGLIGNRIVVIYGGTEAAPILEDGDVLHVGSAVSTEDIMTMLQANNENLLAITTDLKGVTGGISRGEGTLGKLIADEELYTRVTSTVGTLETASADAQDMTASLSTFARKLNTPGALPNAIVTDKTTYATLTRTVNELEQTGGRASVLVDGLAAGAADSRTPVGALMHDQAAGTDVKVALDNLATSTALLEDNLKALQHNFLFRGYFRKQERAAAKAKRDAADAETVP
jgi:phospholipid/cholesterol/gamma-HCH transport system substrate-binding protein